MYHAPYYRLHLLQPIKDLKAKTSADLPAGPVVTEIEATYPSPPFPPPPLPLSPLLPLHTRSSSPAFSNAPGRRSNPSSLIIVFSLSKYLNRDQRIFSNATGAVNFKKFIFFEVFFFFRKSTCFYMEYFLNCFSFSVPVVWQKIHRQAQMYTHMNTHTHCLHTCIQICA